MSQTGLAQTGLTALMAFKQEPVQIQTAVEQQQVSLLNPKPVLFPRHLLSAETEPAMAQKLVHPVLLTAETAAAEEEGISLTLLLQDTLIIS